MAARLLILVRRMCGNVAAPHEVAVAPDAGISWSYDFGDPEPALTQFFDGAGTYYAWFGGYPGGQTVAVAPSGTIVWNVDAGYPVAMGGDGTLYTVNFGSTPSVLTALR